MLDVVTAKPELAAPLLVDPARVPAIAARPARGPARVLGPWAEPRVGCIDASGCEPADACLDGEAPIGLDRRLRPDAAV